MKQWVIRGYDHCAATHNGRSTTLDDEETEHWDHCAATTLDDEETEHWDHCAATTLDDEETEHWYYMLQHSISILIRMHACLPTVWS